MMEQRAQTLYEHLNIPETATREEIEAAYAALMKRFSEDNYLGSPLWDMAEVKRASKLAPQNAEYQKGYEKLLGGPPAAPQFGAGKGARVREVCAEGCGECCCEGLCEGICSAF